MAPELAACSSTSADCGSAAVASSASCAAAASVAASVASAVSAASLEASALAASAACASVAAASVAWASVACAASTPDVFEADVSRAVTPPPLLRQPSRPAAAGSWPPAQATRTPRAPCGRDAMRAFSQTGARPAFSRSSSFSSSACRLPLHPHVPAGAFPRPPHRFHRALAPHLAAAHRPQNRSREHARTLAKTRHEKRGTGHVGQLVKIYSRKCTPRAPICARHRPNSSYMAHEKPRLHGDARNSQHSAHEKSRSHAKRRAARKTYSCVKTSGPSSVTATVCS